MQLKYRLLNVFFGVFFMSTAYSQPKVCGLKENKISTEELSKWKIYGNGEVSTWGDQTSLKEAEETKGVMIISPDIYVPDVILKYKVMALTPSTVLVAMLSVSDTNGSGELTIEENYDGNIGYWKQKNNYFIAFKNASHDRTPFVLKNPNAEKSLANASSNSMIAGIYYEIEVGKKDGKIWLLIDGEKAFEVEDKNPLGGGHIALRIRGTAGFKAGCLIKDMVIFDN